VAAGQTTITVTAGSLSAEATVTVYPTGPLPVGTTRWSITPVNTDGGESGVLVGVSSVDTTSFAVAESSPGHQAYVIRGFTVDAQPTWSVTTAWPNGPPLYPGQVIGEVSGGVLLLAGTTVMRVAPLGPSWRFTAPANLLAMAQSPDGTVFLTTDNTASGSSNSIIALDGLTGKRKFEVSTPSGALRNGDAGSCLGPPSPSPSYLHRLAIDGNGVANVMISTSVFDYCYPYTSFRPKLDVSLYQIATSGAVTVVPLRHYDTGYVSGFPYERPYANSFGNGGGAVLPDDQRGVMAQWTACFVSPSPCESPTARYVNASGAGVEYPVSGAPTLSGAGHRGYTQGYSASTGTANVSAFDMTTGQVFWTSSISSASYSYIPQAALEGGRLRVVDADSGTSAILGPNGSTITTQPNDPLGRNSVMFLGDTQIGVASGDFTSDSKPSAFVSAKAFLDPAAFSMSLGSPAQNNAPQRFATADRAAISALQLFVPQSQKDNLEYGGSICLNGPGQTFFYTAPQVGSPETVVPAPCRSSFTTLAEYHTHPGLAPEDSPSGGDLLRGYQTGLVGFVGVSIDLTTNQPINCAPKRLGNIWRFQMDQSASNWYDTQHPVYRISPEVVACTPTGR
jgi:hypothetical protein